MTVLWRQQGQKRTELATAETQVAANSYFSKIIRTVLQATTALALALALVF